MSDTRSPRPELALMVQVEENYGTYRAVARVYIVDPATGELLSPSWSGRYGSDYGEDVARFEGLEISAYAGNVGGSVSDDLAGQVWGFGVHYAPFRIESAAHAQAIARTMTALERGMAKLETEDGYIRNGEFARYVLRAAKALRIRKVYVRNTPRVFAMSGERYRVTDAPGLEYWTQEVAEKSASRELASLTR